jgi:hypothetical protein
MRGDENVLKVWVNFVRSQKTRRHRVRRRYGKWRGVRGRLVGKRKGCVFVRWNKKRRMARVLMGLKLRREPWRSFFEIARWTKANQ